MANAGELFFLVRILPSLIGEALRQVDMPDAIRAALVPARNLHQSCSNIHPPHMRDALIAALASLETPGFSLELDQLSSVSRARNGASPRWLLQLVGSEPKPAPFQQWLRDLAKATRREQIKDSHSHTAHVSLSYYAPASLNVTLARPVFVPVDHVELVAIAGSGRDYRYETIYRKALGPAVPQLSQASLF